MSGNCKEVVFENILLDRREIYKKLHFCLSFNIVRPKFYKNLQSLLGPSYCQKNLFINFVIRFLKFAGWKNKIHDLMSSFTSRSIKLKKVKTTIITLTVLDQ